MEQLQLFRLIPEILSYKEPEKFGVYSIIWIKMTKNVFEKKTGLVGEREFAIVVQVFPLVFLYNPHLFLLYCEDSSRIFPHFVALFSIQ